MSEGNILENSPVNKLFEIDANLHGPLPRINLEDCKRFGEIQKRLGVGFVTGGLGDEKTFVVTYVTAIPLGDDDV